MTTPFTPISQDDFLAAVQAGTLAPSMHNTQPWRFRLADGALELRSDPGRQLPVADPSGWGVRIACGSALCNARLALAVAHVATELTLRPDPAQPLLMARLRPVGSRPPTAEETALHAAIGHRHSNRLPFLDKPVPAETRARLRAAAIQAGGWLELLVGSIPLTVVTEIVWSAERALRRDPAYRAEQLAWSGRVAGPDGIPAQAAPAPGADRAVLPMREFPGAPETLPRADATQVHEYEADPLVAVLGTAADTPTDQLTAGIALQRVLLAATDAGLATSLLSQAIEVPAAREQLRIGLGRYGAPQMVLRIGYGEPAPPSPRRPATEVIDP